MDRRRNDTHRCLNYINHEKIYLAAPLIAFSTFCFAQNNCHTIKQDKQRLACFDSKSKSDIASQKTNEDLKKVAEENSAKELEFNKSALTFIRDAQANLAILALQWKTWNLNPQTANVTNIIADKNKYKDTIKESFSVLMAMPGKSDKSSEKLKDYYAAWGLAIASISPMQSDSARTADFRINETLRNMDATAERIKLDLQ